MGSTRIAWFGQCSSARRALSRRAASSASLREKNSIIIAPMLMFGCAYYPWRGLDAVPAFKYGVLVNPLVYVAEAMRGSLTPSLPHMPLAVSCAAMAALSALFLTLGIRAFTRRAMS